MTEDWQAGGFGLYVHWPFCAAKCPYCDFNSHVVTEIDQTRWRDAYLSEIARYAAEVPGRVLTSIFFGGGTPSLMPPETVAAIIETIRASWPAVNDLEVTLEANPTSVEAGRFAAYAEAGVSRVSLGVQALNDTDLRRLGRQHSAVEALQAFEIAQKFFERTSFDLIYARQDQTLADWRGELGRALALGADHLSLYQLTIESGTAFGDRYAAGGLRGLPEDDLAADLYEATQDMCDAAGLSAYEVSNHARPGSESRHNMIYWRYGDYVGIGPGAHGRLTVDGVRHATENWLAPAKWLAEAESGSGESLRTPLAPKDQAIEYLLMGLRLRDGVDLRRYDALASSPLSEPALAHLTDLGMVDVTGSRLAVTDRGRPLLNAILRDLLG